MKTKRGPGRPAKPKAEKQSEAFGMYLTKAEAKQFRADIERLELTPSAFLSGLWRAWRQDRKG